jgi:hypothetical protein
MAAAEITPKYFNLQGSVPVVGRFLKVTQADWIVLPYPGVLNIRGTLYTGADEATLSFGTITVNNKGTAYTATDTAIVGDAAAITRQTPYYIQTTSGELILVTVDATPATSTATLSGLVRGCLGTTASATGLADDNTVYIRNMVVFGAATTGYVGFVAYPMPREPKAALYA